jgi:hypothetical protein
MVNIITESGSLTIDVDRIDNYTNDVSAGLIKMDIEGAELAALRGAEQTIRRDKPILAISGYHRADDMITLPQYIRQLAPEYNLFVRNSINTVTNQCDMVLFAVPDENLPK